MNLTFDELLRFTGEERDKWRAWFVDHPAATELEVQPGARYTTVGALIDHIFLVERRHLQRLADVRPDEQTGLSGRHAPPLFDYGASVRRELEQVRSISIRTSPMSCGPSSFRAGEYTLTPRKLLFHCLLHEIRHWAQVALAVRRAGLTPPGNHDLFYSKALR